MDAPVNKLRTWSIIGAVGLSVVFIFGLLWLFLLAPARPEGFGWYLFSFATGLSMLVLPCTLPLAFVIVPMAMGKGFAKGLSTALAFGSGVALTLSFYGVAAAIVGNLAISQLETPLETVKNYVYTFAGIIVYFVALGEIGLIKFHLPTYTGGAPAFIQKRGNILKAFLLGMFLGNIGVGCPHPATPLILIEIASSGDVLYGWLLFLTHAIGRVLPLLLLAIFAILGINGLNWLVTKKDKIEKASGWAMVFVAGFIFTLGLFTHDWWVNSGTHSLLEKVTQEERLLDLLGKKIETEQGGHAHGLEEGVGLFELPLSLGNYVLVGLWIIPMIWWLSRERKKIGMIPESDTVPKRESEEKLWKSKRSFVIALSLLLATTFAFAIPQWFFYVGSGATHEATGMDEHPHDAQMEEAMKEGKMGHDGHSAMYHEEGTVSTGLSVRLQVDHVEGGADEKDGLVKNGAAAVGEATRLTFFATNMPGGAPVDKLEISHDKDFHVIGVRDDLSEFIHIHPTKVESGIWTIDHIFTRGGTYKFYSDSKYEGVTHSFGHNVFVVPGEGEGDAREAKSISKNVIVGDYQVAVRYPEPLTAEDANPIEFVVYDVFGNPVELENYLAVKMHLAVMSDDLTRYLHTHPEDHGDHAAPATDGHTDHEHSLNFDSILGARVASAHGGVDDGHAVNPEVVSFSVSFPKPGTYKMFAQFRPKGIALPPDQPLVAPFYVSVLPHDHKVSGDSKILPKDPRFDSGEKAPQTSKEPYPKSAVVLISIVAMVLFTLIVRRYLESKKT